MSERSRNLPRRSVLAVPGSSDRFLAKAPSLDADMFVLDLEDAVAPAEKPAARRRVAEAIAGLDFGERVVAVRVNSWTTPYTFRDVLEVVSGAGARLDELMLPKVEHPSQVQAIDLLLSQIEAECGLRVPHVGLEVQIESATGVQNLAAICSSSPRIEAVVMGPVDLAASLGMPILTGGDLLADYPGDHYHGVHLALVVAARVAGIQVIDGPYLRLDNPAGLEVRARRTRALGFDGKWAIHPDQVDTLNRIFSPDPEQLARAEAILAALERGASDEGRGALRDDGEMLDEASAKMANAIVARARRQLRGDGEGPQ